MSIPNLTLGDLPVSEEDHEQPHFQLGVATPAKLAPGATMDLRLAGIGKAIPAEATSAFLNITLDEDANLQSFLTVWPSGEPRPLTSANNALPGLVAAASAYNTAPATILAPTLTGAPITFDTAGPADGSVTRTNTPSNCSSYPRRGDINRARQRNNPRRTNHRQLTRTAT